MIQVLADLLAVVAAEEAVVVDVEVVVDMSVFNISPLGVGISFRSHFKDLVFLNREKIDFLEIMADHYIDAPREKMDELELLLHHFVLVPHAINLSLGSAKSVNKDYLQKLATLIDRINPPYWSEHISFNVTEGIEIGHLSPLPFTKSSIETIVSNIDMVCQKISKPLVLENISYLVNLGDEEMKESEFLSEILLRSDSGLLLDLTNLYYNSQNHEYDTSLFLRAIPLDRVVQIHFTGGVQHGNVFIDNHSSKTPKEVWVLMENLFSVAKVKGAILERDDSHPAFSEIIEDTAIARGLGRKHNLWT